MIVWELFDFYERVREIHSTDPMAIRRRDDMGFTPIWVAAATGNERWVRLLLELGVGDDVCNSDNSNRWTPLQAAQRKFRHEFSVSPIVTLLKDAMAHYGIVHCTCNECNDG